jgi:hypothetical protein
MAAALQICCQRYQVGTKQPGPSDSIGHFGFVITLAMSAPITKLLIFGNNERLLEQFNVLEFFHRFLNGL